MKRSLQIISAIIVEISLIVFLVILGIKIVRFINERAKGIHYLTRINRLDIEFSSSSGGLKYFYEPKPNAKIALKADWLGHDVEYQVNADTLFEKRDYSNVKQEKTYRIVSIGDSFVFGAYVEQSENFSKLLENRLNSELNCKSELKFEVINLGNGGYDIQYAVNRFIKRGIKYNPDLVIWLINNWDFVKINEEEIPLIREYQKNGIKYNSSNGTWDDLIKVRKDKLSKYGIEYIIKHQSISFQLLSEKYKKPILILTFPSLERLYYDAIKRNIENKSKFIIYSDLFDVNKDETYLFPDKHPNVKGHKKIAEDIFQYLKKNILTECN